MPRFEPFRALRYRSDDPENVGELTSPPYDVFDESTRETYARQHVHNVVHIDYPVESDGPRRYAHAAETLAAWIDQEVLHTDRAASFSIYRMHFVDESGNIRETAGVIGALEVVDVGAPGVLPHEQTTPKAKTDRLDLTRATRANLSPVWGLSLNVGLSSLLAEPGELVADITDEDGVRHVIERVDDPDRVASISEHVSRQPVLIADGHHRYAISRTYRDEMRGKANDNGAAELTMTYVAELVEEQLSIAAIHRLYTDVDATQVTDALARYYDTNGGVSVTPETIAEMSRRGAICLVDAHGNGTYFVPRESQFTGIRRLDSARLEHALSALPHTVRYQHGVKHVLDSLAKGEVRCAVLIRPVGIDEIRHTATSGELMPPKSTFFTPKLRTGLVMRSLDV